MLSVATVRSAGGAANYFAADNYYTRGDADRSGEWIGDGATRLGLEGEVDPKSFEAVLRGELPGGARVGSDGREHRAGIDLTFSLPKSWSLIALVGGDTRILEAYREAVKETLGWAERNAAETRMMVGGKEKVVATRNLVVALFQHDTNRNQEPNAHLHAVVANVTQGEDGKWRALWNGKLWANNTLLNSMTMARFRESVEKLGYETGPVLKHGNFEAAGISRDAVMAFSSRRQEILEQAKHMVHSGPKVMDAATLMTRAAKPAITDREALAATWKEAASDLGIDFTDIIAKANARATRDLGGLRPLADGLQRLTERGCAWITEFARALGGKESDPLLPAYLARKDRPEIAAAQAVASAVRHLSEREAAFAVTDVYKTALDFGLPATMPAIEARVGQLIASGQLLKGQGPDKGLVTTADALAQEARILAAAEQGRGAVTPVIAAEAAGRLLQTLSERRYGLRLNDGQEAAGRLILGSIDRIIAIQGVAGAGKSTLLRPVAELLRREGIKVVGLAVQNTLVQLLEGETRIPSMTVARFLRSHRDLLGEAPDANRLVAARKDYAGAVVLLDEASMVGNADQEKLVRLANLLELARFVAIGDKRQLGAVDAGKPFAVMQAAGVDTAVMNRNIRARDAVLLKAQSAAQGGHVVEALGFLKPHTMEVNNNGAITAAETWLGLSPEERERTAI
ncbi:MAG: MobF family relaxase, partial [Novosphingobium sp.]